MVTQFRTSNREDLPDGTVKFTLPLHRLATDPDVIRAFSEGHVVGGTVNINGEDWRVTRVQPAPFLPSHSMGDQIWFTVFALPEASVAAEESEKQLLAAVSLYEIKIRSAAMALIKTCIDLKIDTKTLDKLLNKEVK